MIFKKICMYLFGYLNISIEGFFIERFINSAKQKRVLLNNLYFQNNSYVNVNIIKSDFRTVCKIAKKTRCKIKINKKIRNSIYYE